MKLIILATLLVLATPAHADVATPPSSKVSLKLVDAGSGAKQTLRFTGKKGLRKRMIASVRMAMSTAGTTIPIPTIEMTMDAQITDVAANGDLTCEITFTKVAIKADKTTPPAAAETFKRMSDQMSGIKGRMKFSSRGFVIETILDIPTNLDPALAKSLESMKTALEQVSSPMPEEAVGVGATWETTQSVRSPEGIDIDQTATMKVVKLKGNRADIQLQVVQRSPSKALKIQGMAVDLEAYTGSGSGTMVLDAKSFLPAKSDMKMGTKMTMGMNGQKIDMAVDMSMTLSTR